MSFSRNPKQGTESNPIGILPPTYKSSGKEIRGVGHLGIKNRIRKTLRKRALFLAKRESK